MQQKLQLMEFGVAGLEEVRTLVKRWKKVLAELAGEEDEGPAMVWKTHRPVGIEVEDRRPGEEVLLTFRPPGRSWRGSWPISGRRGWRSVRSPSSPGCSSPAGSSPGTSSRE